MKTMQIISDEIPVDAGIGKTVPGLPGRDAGGQRGGFAGLAGWRAEAFFIALHASYLQDRYPDTEISVSLPRIRPHVGEFRPTCPVEDRLIVQIMTALRLFMLRLGITISTSS
jgi:hypothetical protein